MGQCLFFSFIEAPIFGFLQVLLTKHATVEVVAGMTVIKQLRNFSVLIPTYFFSTLLAFAGKMNAEKRFVEYFNKFDRYFKIFALAGIGIGFLLSVSGKGLLWLYSPEYVSDWLGLCISNACIPLAMIITLIKQELLLQEHQRYMMVVSILTALSWIGAYYALYAFGIEPLVGFFIGEAICLVISFSLLYMYYQKDKNSLLLR